MFEPLAKATTSPRFIRLDDQGNPVAEGTPHAIVRDTATRLDWLVEYPSSRSVNFDKAQKVCADLRVGGHDDWRLPTRFELESILDLSAFRPAIDTNLFPGTEPDWHWSSSPDASDPEYAWIVHFDSGYVGLLRRDYCAFVRAVRSVPASQ